MVIAQVFFHQVMNVKKKRIRNDEDTLGSWPGFYFWILKDSANTVEKIDAKIVPDGGIHTTDNIDVGWYELDFPIQSDLKNAKWLDREYNNV